MLSPTKKVMPKHKILLVKMAFGHPYKLTSEVELRKLV
jgi:hypothetical protein